MFAEATPSAPSLRAPARAPAARAHNPGLALVARKVNAWYGTKHALRDIELEVERHAITALIGPSGCGKSTFLRCINRMHETIPGARAEGELLLDGRQILGTAVDPVLLRRRVGMVFQKPNPFPSMTIRENVLAGLRLTGGLAKADADALVEKSLRRAALWDEVKDVLDRPGTSMSGGQQQRLCIARAIAVEPEVLLMDEPCSALDPISTRRIEELMLELKERYTIVIVTHNMQQAQRVATSTAFFLLGERIEQAPTEQLFRFPTDERTADYVQGRFG
jgi:phosphate transport system ATP-binding protein